MLTQPHTTSPQPTDADDLRDRVRRGDYEIDAHAVAEAILRRLRDR